MTDGPNLEDRIADGTERVAAQQYAYSPLRTTSEEKKASRAFDPEEFRRTYEEFLKIRNYRTKIKDHPGDYESVQKAAKMITGDSRFLNGEANDRAVIKTVDRAFSAGQEDMLWYAHKIMIV